MSGTTGAMPMPSSAGAWADAARAASTSRAAASGEMRMAVL